MFLADRKRYKPSEVKARIGTDRAGIARCAAALAVVAMLVWVAPAAASPYGFSSAPTEQLAEPGWPVSVEVLPDGSVRTGYWEVRFRLGGHPLEVGSRTWDAGYLPVLRGVGCEGAVCAKTTYVYERVAGTPALIVRLELRNRGRRAAKTQFVAQLASTFESAAGAGVFTNAQHHRFPAPAETSLEGMYSQPGQAFSAAAVQSVAGSALRRDGKTLLVAKGARVAAHKAAHASSVAGDASLNRRLKPGGHVTTTLVLPLAPPAADTTLEAQLRQVSVGAAIKSVKGRWRAVLAPAAARIKIPERKGRDAVLAAIVTLLGSRMPAADGSGAWVQHVNALQYRAFWLRDGALMATALGRAGLEGPAREDLAFMSRWQTSAGQLVSRTGQLDGTGEGLWSLGEYARRTRDSAWAAQQLPIVAKAVAWVADVRSADPLGLLPKGDPHDNEFVSGHLTGDNAWTVSGLRAAADLATIAGDPALATKAATQADQLQAALRTAATAAALRTSDGAVPSSLDPGVQSGQLDGGTEGFDWGNYLLQWPEALPASDPLVTATVKRAERRSAEGLALWGRKNLHTYVGFGIRMAQLRGGDQADAIDGYYGMLTHTNSTHGSFETGMRAFKGRSAQNNIAPHGTFGADLTLLTLALLVDDRPDAVHLASAVPPVWLRPGRTTAIGPLATRYGAVSLTIKANRGGARLRWTAPATAKLVLHRPPWAKGAALTEVTGSGSARWSWKRALPNTSFRTEARALQRAYRAHHKTPPSGTP
ncbi:MAG TPA: hypothetical protein VNT22_08605 [Baekduia sp.]|nr:hypothetical protein [Baekduia sp.]